MMWSIKIPKDEPFLRCRSRFYQLMNYCKTTSGRRDVKYCAVHDIFFFTVNGTMFMKFSKTRSRQKSDEV